MQMSYRMVRPRLISDKPWIEIGLPCQVRLHHITSVLPLSGWELPPSGRSCLSNVAQFDILVLAHMLLASTSLLEKEQPPFQQTCQDRTFWTEQWECERIPLVLQRDLPVSSFTVCSLASFCILLQHVLHCCQHKQYRLIGYEQLLVSSS